MQSHTLERQDHHERSDTSGLHGCLLQKVGTLHLTHSAVLVSPLWPVPSEPQPTLNFLEQQPREALSRSYTRRRIHPSTHPRVQLRRARASSEACFTSLHVSRFSPFGSLIHVVGKLQASADVHVLYHARSAITQKHKLALLLTNARSRLLLDAYGPALSASAWRILPSKHPG